MSPFTFDNVLAVANEEKQSHTGIHYMRDLLVKGDSGEETSCNAVISHEKYTCGLYPVPGTELLNPWNLLSQSVIKVSRQT